MIKHDYRTGISIDTNLASQMSPERAYDIRMIISFLELFLLSPFPLIEQDVSCVKLGLPVRRHLPLMQWINIVYDFGVSDRMGSHLSSCRSGKIKLQTLKKNSVEYERARERETYASADILDTSCALCAYVALCIMYRTCGIRIHLRCDAIAIALQSGIVFGID